MLGLISGSQTESSAQQRHLAKHKGVNSLFVGAYALLDGWATAEGAYRSYQVGADNWVMAALPPTTLIKEQMPVINLLSH